MKTKSTNPQSSTKGYPSRKVDVIISKQARKPNNNAYIQGLSICQSRPFGSVKRNGKWFSPWMPRIINTTKYSIPALSFCSGGEFIFQRPLSEESYTISTIRKSLDRNFWLEPVRSKPRSALDLFNLPPAMYLVLVQLKNDSTGYPTNHFAAFDGYRRVFYPGNGNLVELSVENVLDPHSAENVLKSVNLINIRDVVCLLRT